MASAERVRNHGARPRTWIAAIGALLILVPLGWMWQASLLPDTYDMAEMGYVDWGDGPVEKHHAVGHGTPVADLVADPDRRADIRARLAVRLEDGRYTVNGTSPGPTIEATVGDLVEVRLVNVNVEDGTTLHWHGVDVTNGADGVAGITQDAVAEGAQHVYRFIAEDAGTYWYHSHQISHEQVRRGLLGALIVQPEVADPADREELALLHRYSDGPTINGVEGLTALAAEPGEVVRLRVVNTDNVLAPLWVTGGPYQVLAIDGTEVNDPSAIENLRYGLPAGGRVDLGLVIPESGLRVDFAGTTAIAFHKDPAAGHSPRPPEESVDLLSYGRPAVVGFDPDEADRRFEYRIGKRPGFLDGRPGMWWTINGHLFPDVPMYMVSEGDTVVFTIENDSGDNHPMHLHGHHAVVLSRDGQPATGSPWWVDSLEVSDKETYEIAFLADNPGIWMDHCHNLPHAREGLVTHLMYTGVESSYVVGGDFDNEPE